MKIKIDEAREFNVFLDSDCAESCYGVPVLVYEWTDGTREVFGPGDAFPANREGPGPLTCGDVIKGQLAGSYRATHTPEQIAAMEKFVLV